MINNEKTYLLSNRLKSLDALRGFDMFWIIGGEAIFRALAKATNNGFLISLLPQLEHAEWQGFSAYDVIWPLFLFIVGVAMTFSIRRRLDQGDSKKSIYLKVIKRTLLLFVFGLIIDCNILTYDVSQFFVYNGALHTIGMGYLIAALIMLNFRLLWQIILTLAIPVIYRILLVTIPVPGYGAGVLTPDGNFAIYIDKLVLGGLQHGSTYAYILPSFMFGSMVMFGALTGQLLLLRSDKSDKSKLLWLVGLGVSCLVIGLIWNEWFPFIKKIKNSSFMIYAEGWCFLLTALFYFCFDVLKKDKWVFGFIVIGMNPLVVYMATQLFKFTTIADIFIGGLEPSLGVWFSLLQATVAFTIIWLILFWMYRKKSFIKI